MTAHGKRIRVLIVGAGPGGVAMFDLFRRTEEVEVVAMIDKRADAPGLALAREAGLPTATGWEGFLDPAKIDVIVDVTGSDQAHAALQEEKPDAVDLLGGNVAHVFWALVEHHTAIDRENARFRAALDASADSFFLIDRNHMRFVDVNATACTSTGYGREELLALGPQDIKPLKSRRQLEEEFDVVIDGSEVGSIETLHQRKDGSTYPVQVFLAAIAGAQGPLIIANVRDMTAQERTGHIMAAVNDCLLSLGADYEKNVRRITRATGEILGAASALYNVLEGDRLVSRGTWHVPPDFQVKDRSEGHVCSDVIRQNSDDPSIISDFAGTPYAESDPNVRTYGLKSYIGHVVRRQGKPVGALCAVFAEENEVTVEERWAIATLAGILSTEEERNHFQRSLQEKLAEIERLNDFMVGRERRIIEIKQEVNNLLQKFGQEPKYTV